MDEISVSSVTKIVEISEDEEEKEYIFDPREIGVKICRSDELKGGDAVRNARIAREMLNGENHTGVKEAVLLNAGAALYISGNAESIKAGYENAKDAFARGLVKDKIDQIIAESQKLV
jgi:anthranilate phosphoribosyltransferase